MPYRLATTQGCWQRQLPTIYMKGGFYRHIRQLYMSMWAARICTSHKSYTTYIGGSRTPFGSLSGCFYSYFRLRPFARLPIPPCPSLFYFLLTLIILSHLLFNVNIYFVSYCYILIRLICLFAFTSSFYYNQYPKKSNICHYDEFVDIFPVIKSI